MKIIVHRRNTRESLLATPTHYGVEVDIRSQADNLIIHHDPFQTGESFESWIAHYQHGTLILNVKEEGLEKRLVELMNKHNISDYFFLDQSYPFLVKSANSGLSQCAVRVSEYEPIEGAMTLAGKVKWVWVDCFSKLPLTEEQASQLHHAGFQICLVSPELQGRDATVEIPKLKALLNERNIKADAVCTKEPRLWEAT